MSKRRLPLGRRDFLKWGTIGACGGLLASCGSNLVGSSNTTGVLEVTERTVPIPGLTPQYAGLTFGFISDIHHGQAIDPNWITRIVEEVNSRAVDFLFLGGDYLWIPESVLSKSLLTPRNNLFDGLKGSTLAEAIYSDLFIRLRTAKTRYGTFGVMGNHDRWISPHLCERIFTQQTGELLINHRTDVPLQGGGVVEVYGSDDYWNGLPTAPNFSRTPSRLRVFLTHNPDHVIEDCLPALPPGSLVFAGHTHGGQICLPAGIGAVVYNIRSREYGYGLHQVSDSTLFTSRGVGVVEIPFRINCPQEVVFITLSTDSEKATSEV